MRRKACRCPPGRGAVARRFRAPRNWPRHPPPRGGKPAPRPGRALWIFFFGGVGPSRPRDGHVARSLAKRPSASRVAHRRRSGGSFCSSFLRGGLKCPPVCPRRKSYLALMGDQRLGKGSSIHFLAASKFTCPREYRQKDSFTDEFPSKSTVNKAAQALHCNQNVLRDEGKRDGLDG